MLIKLANKFPVTMETEISLQTVLPHGDEAFKMRY
jgi:hypothetical protein